MLKLLETKMVKTHTDNLIGFKLQFDKTKISLKCL